jgi:hypothetical protein
MTNPLMEEFTLESWHLTEPNFSNPVLFVPAFKHAVQPGHFVKVINSGVTLIGRLIGTSMHHAETRNEVTTLTGLAKVNWFLPSSSLILASNTTVEQSSNIFLSENTELIQTRKGSWVDTSCIKEICFVFSYLDVIDGKYYCEGISNAYYIRYRYISETLGIEAISKKSRPFFEFPSCYPTFPFFWTACFSTELWQSIVIIQQAITGLLCRYAQSQGMHPSGRCRVNMSKSIMTYLSSWLQTRNIYGYSTACSQMQKHIRCVA